MYSHHVFAAVFMSLFATLIASTAIAQPSGGPYGPIQQKYELPQAKTLYYVAPDGQDSADGLSLENPTTLESAISKVVTGDAIILRGGTYRTGGLRLNQGITMQPYEEEHPVIKGTEIASDWESVGDGKWQTSWTRLFPAAPADWWRREREIEKTPLYLFNNDMLFIDGKLLDTVGAIEDVDENSYTIDYENGIITIGTDPTDKLVEITAQNSALVRTMRRVHGKENDRQGPTLRGITFTQYARLALEVEGTEPGELMHPSKFGKEVVGTTFENLTISHCSRVAGYFRGDGLTIRHCLVSDCGTEGIYIINSSDVLLENNIVTRTNSSEKLSGYYASSVKIFNQTYNVVCRDNLIIDNPHASGVWYDVGNIDGVFINNWVERTNNGFFFEISKGAICAGNVFVNCSTGIRILNSSSVEMYQNTLYNSQATITRTPRSHKVGDHFGWHTSAGPSVEERHSHTFVNNLMAGDENFGGSLLSLYQNPELRERLTEPQVIKLDGNVYARRTSSTPQHLIRWSPADTEDGIQYFDTLEDFQSTFGQFEQNAVSHPDYWGPLFLSPELKNFELMQEFPSSDAGLPLPRHIRNALNWKLNRATHPGAYKPE